MTNSALLFSLQEEEYVKLYMMRDSLENLWDSLPSDSKNLRYYPEDIKDSIQNVKQLFVKIL